MQCFKADAFAAFWSPCSGEEGDPPVVLTVKARLRKAKGRPLTWEGPLSTFLSRDFQKHDAKVLLNHGPHTYYLVYSPVHTAYVYLYGYLVGSLDINFLGNFGFSLGPQKVALFAEVHSHQDIYTISGWLASSGKARSHLHRLVSFTLWWETRTPSRVKT